MNTRTPEGQGGSTPPVNDAWTTFITPFCTTTGKTVDEANTALKHLIGDPGEEAISLLQDEALTPFEDIKAQFEGVPSAKLKLAVRNLRKVEEAATVAASQFSAPASFDTLPVVPDDGAWIEMLKTGGILKVSQGVVISGIRAGLANRTGLFDLPKLLSSRMEEHAEELEEPVTDEFYKLRNMLTKRSYADIFSAMENVDGTFASQAKKTALLNRCDVMLWPALSGFQGQLQGWTESWQAGMNSPGMMMTAIAAMATGGNAAMPPGMMQPPPTDTLRDAADGVVDSINRMFAGTGIPVAMALAYDAKCIKDVVENSSLPTLVGAANREQMLKMLGVNVSADYVRLERNLTRFVLGIMELPKLTAGNEEIAYITSLLMLGSQIPWDKLSAGNERNTSRRRSSRNEEAEPALS